MFSMSVSNFNNSLKAKFESEFELNLQKLNPEQRLAVETIDGAVMVIAGPGSGKTQLLAMRVANILRETDISPSNILCLTFTNTGTRNMQERLAKIIGSQAYSVNIYTFHSFGSSIISQYPVKFFDRFGIDATAVDELSQFQIFNTIMKGLGRHDPLRLNMNEEGWIYLGAIKLCIQELKKGGLTPDDFRAIVLINQQILEQFQLVIDQYQVGLNLPQTSNGNRTIFLATVENIVSQLGKICEQYPSKFQNSVYSFFGLEFLVGWTTSINEDKASIKLKTSATKKYLEKYFNKTEQNLYRLKDLANLQKHLSVCDIYEQYNLQTLDNGLYDFDDMILEVVKKLQNDQELKFNLLEKYQYILVDEFQDTSGAQLELIRQLADPSFHPDGNPNIMAVGDDDQSIYKFQGASSFNIIEFQNFYPQCKFITLQKNYRSSHKIVEVGKLVANQITDRITQFIPEVDKNIQAHNQKPHSLIHYSLFDSALEESIMVIEKIKELIQNGIEPKDIAIIASKHKYLENIVSLAQKMDLPINYQRGNNIFNQPKILQLLTMMKYIATLNCVETPFWYEKEELLCEILQYDFFSFEPKHIRKLAFLSRQNKKSWLDTILDQNSANKSQITPEINLKEYSQDSLDKKLEQDFWNEVYDIALFFLSLSKSAKNDSGEKIIDRLIGVDTAYQSDETTDEVIYDFEDQDSFESFDNPNDLEGFESDLEPKSNYKSQYKKKYFDKFLQELTGQENLQLLSGLRCLITTIRGFEQGKVLKLSKIVEILSIYQQEKTLNILDNSSFMTSNNSVNLLTAHGSKGLEFKKVFVIACNQKIWCGSGHIRNLSLPSNLPLKAENDNLDDKTRLFYVALTRAEEDLYLSSFGYDDDTKTSELVFLQNIDKEHYDLHTKIQDKDLQIRALEYSLQVKIPNIIIDKPEHRILESLLVNYKMPVTHLNNFLDLEPKPNSPAIGPKRFLEYNLLQFPQTPSNEAGYGTAMHAALESFYVQNQYINKNINIGKPPLDFLLEKFELAMEMQKMDYVNKIDLLKSGKQNLESWYNLKGELENNYQIEYSFGSGVKIGEAMVAGKLDKMLFDYNKREILVVDYKTGKVFTKWDRHKTNKAIFEVGDLKTSREQGDQNQLVFYKLLVENSGEFRDKYTVKNGRIEFLDYNKYEINGTKATESLILDLEISQQESEKMYRLIQAVWKRIMNLDFNLPVGVDFENNLSGTKKWRQWLIDNG